MTSTQPGHNRRSSRFRKLLGEPTLHFALLAALLFLVSAARDQGQNVVEVSRGAVEWRILEAATALEVSLSQEEEQEIARDYLDEVILAEEAKRLGLDRDARIQIILSQKLQHVWSGDVIPPTQAELEAFYAENISRYAGLPSVTLDEVVFVGDRSGKPPVMWAREMDTESLAETEGVKHSVLERVTADDLSWAFGADVAESILAADSGEWIGPLTTIRGAHWFRITDRFASVIPPLDSIREMVRADWLAEREDSLLRERLEELRRRYTVKLVDGRSNP